jgi:hypothetical protein
MELEQAVAAFRRFCGLDLTRTLAQVEASVRGATSRSLEAALESFDAREEVLIGAGQLKRIVGQINVVIHALGILLCLPRLLEPEEIVQYVSLGGGNTGRAFDLETDRRVAEFKFIQWQGGPESIRQNQLFKDFFLLAEHEGPKQKYLYVLGTEHPLKFLNGGRSLLSVLSKDVGLQRQFHVKFGDQYQTVRQYFEPRRNSVVIQDVSPWLQGFVDARIHSVV